MNYMSVAEIAKKWNMSERTVRNYCAQNRIPGVFLTGKTWNIPESAVNQAFVWSGGLKRETALAGGLPGRAVAPFR